MSKKKSYMDIGNILKESIIKKLFKWFVATPALKKSKKFQDNLKKLNKDIKDFEHALNDELKDINPDAKQIKVEPYKLKDFV